MSVPLEPLEKLVDTADPAWPVVERWLSTGLSDVVLIERDAKSSESTLVHMQTSTRSILGALAYECGGLVIDSRVRVLGGGTPEVKSSLKSWNGLPHDLVPIERGLVRVGFDACGGVFALDGGAFGKGDGSVHYFAADNLDWEDLGIGHSAWLHWLITEPDKVNAFYEALTWPDWKLELSRLKFDQALTFYPPPWSAEGRDLSKVTRKATPAHEVVKVLFDTAKQMS